MRPKPIRLFSRAVMLLLMMLFTATTAWATDVTVTYKISVSSTLKATITNVETGNTVCYWDHGIKTLWPANETHQLSDYGISLTPNRDLDKTGENEDGNNASTTAFRTERPTTFSVSVPNNSQYYLKSVTFKEDDTEKASLEVAPNNKYDNVNITGRKFFNYITVELTTDRYYRLTPSNSLNITTTPARTYDNAKYYVAGTDITITPTNASCIVESVSGVNNATIAADKRSFSFAMPAWSISPSATLTEVHTISGVPNDVSISDPYTTIGSTKYYLTNQTYTLTAPTNKVFSSFTATGATSSSVAANKNSATITIGSSDVTVSATLLTIGGTCGNGLTWSMSDSDSDGTYDRLTLSGSGTLSTSPWATDFAASITRVDISSADIVISGNPFSTLDSSADIVVPSPAYAVYYASADFADKLRAQFGSYLFGVTIEGGTAAYAITDQGDLQNLASAINNGSEGIANGKTFRQTGNITFLGSYHFEPVGFDSTKYFSGTYDGGGYTISGLHIEFLANIYTYGLFGYVKNGLVENVRLVSPSANVNNAYYYGALIGCADGTKGASTTIRNCVVIRPENNASGNFQGAIIGAQDGCKLQNLYFYGGNCNNAIGGGYSGTDAVRARMVILGDGIASVTPVINPAATNLDNGFVYNNDLYYREGLELTLANNLSEKTGYHAIYKADGITLTDNTYTVRSANNVVILTTEYTNNTYTISFNGNGGTCGDGEMGDQAFTYDKAQNLTDNAFNRVGYTFAGWNTQADGNGTSYSDKENVNNLITTNGGTMTLYAQWTANTYTVTLNNQSATTAGSESATATYDAAMPAITVPTRTGYTFGGYYTEENGGGTQYYNADGTSANNWIIAEDTTLYAQWTANTYTVTFEIEGGNGGSESATATYDATMPAITVPERTGYTFGGYYTEANGGGTQYYYADGTSANNWNIAEDTPLYAQWTANTYTVTFDNQSATTAGSESATATYDAAMPAITVPERTGYTFGGYYTEENGGGTQYYNADGTSANNWIIAEDTTLYAQWTANTYTVAFNANGGTCGDGEMGDQAFTYDEAQNITANAFTRTGYTFAGWNTQADGNGTSYSDKESVNNLITTNGGTMTLYAQWTANTYTVTLNNQSATTAGSESATATYDAAMPAITVPTRTGYTFGGYYTEENGGGTQYYYADGTSANNWIIAEDTTLYAQWTANTYTVTFDNQSATTAGSESATATYDAAMPAITVPTRTGYTFGGYYTEENGGGTQYYNADGTSANNWIIAEDTTLYAKWTANTYTVKFNGNGGTCGDGEMGDQTFTYDEAQNITANAFTRTGYTFAGWNTQADGNGTSYSDKESVNNLITTNGGTMTLYAQWTANTYTVAFNANGGSGSMSDQTFTYDEAQNLTANAFTRTGCIFAGWATSANGDVVYSDQQSVSNLTTENNGTVTLYAKWVVPYINADGNTQYCSNFTVLTNATDISDLNKGWYVVTEDVSYSSWFHCGSGDIHLILCDNAKMTVELNGSAIKLGGNGSLTIYAQSTGSSMGKLIATASSASGIDVVGSVSICGGNITATGKNSNGCSGIYANGNITIHSGQVSASGDYGIRVNGTITLGLRNVTDYITASRYNKNVNIAGGQTLYDVNNTPYSGNNVSIPGGKTLRPLVIPTLELSDNADNAEAIGEAAAASTGGSLYNVILSGRTLYKDDGWNTLCLPFALSAKQIAASPLAGATIMELDGTSSDLTNGTLTLNFNDAKEIEAGRPYIVKWPIGRNISTPSDWHDFVEAVADGNTYEGKTVRLAADIEVSEMAGTYTHPFKGTFDGCGHKLTVTLNNNDDSDMGTSEQYQGVAPFRFTQGATIKNLTVDGTVSTTNRKFAAGFIGWALESTNNIQNCTSSVEINSTINGDGTHGGFVGKASGTLNITNCLFNGMMTTSQTNGTNSCGGFVGWAATANTGVTIKNSLYAPATIPNGKHKISTSNSATFARNGANINESYYTETFGTAQGTSTGGATGSALKNLLGDGWQVKDGKIVPVTTTIDIVNPVFTGVTIDDSNGDVTSKDGNVSFKGTYAPINWTVETPSILFVGEKNQLHWPLAGAHLNAFRAYFELADPNAKVREFNMTFGEETTSIDHSPLNIDHSAGAWYTVNGVKLSGKPTKKGLYIHNGKKVVIK